MTNPFRIEGPGMVSFSGGRTSALMLRRILDAYDDAMPSDVHVLFANTGKERAETLVFVHEVETRWKVPVVWLERDKGAGFRVVDFSSASRNGEPFSALISERQFLPNPVTRYCTQELKIHVMKKWMMAQGYDHWTNVVGFRADEPGRVSRAKAGEGKDRWDLSFPLSDAGVTQADVMAFWRCSSFDLNLRTWEGNCDLCMLKGTAKRKRIMRDRSDLAGWWMEMEMEPLQSKPSGARFRVDSPSYQELYHIAQRPMLPFEPSDIDGTSIDDLGDCVCHD
jgi:3'-phosphoadenosine 5'-phosphosulfate sulfotransferase (PAPS reductase)/FAD synthetase